MSCGGCCRWCLGFQFTVGLTILFMWLSLRPSKPSIVIAEFYVPALNKTASQTQPLNTTIVFQVKLVNKNKNKGIHYGALNVTLCYGPDQTAIANTSVPHFYQGFKKTARKWAKVTVAGRQFWNSAINDSSAVFRVVLRTAVRYEIFWMKTGHHRLCLTGNVTVNHQGKKTEKKNVKLHSDAHVSYPVPTLTMSLLLLVLVSLC